MNQNILILLTITITAASSQSLPPGLVTTMIQDLLSPANTKQILINKRNIQKPVRRFAISDLPSNRNEPKKILVQNPMGPTYPNNVIIQKQETGGQRQVIIQKGDKIIVGNQPILKTVDGVPRNVVIRKEVPQRVVVNDAILNQQLRPIETPKTIIIQEPRKAYPVKTVPAQPRMATPVSAQPRMATPMPPQSRAQYLRKIPIPPPTL